MADHINPEEIEAVERLIEHLLDCGYCLDSPGEIGVISPYRAQADALQSHLLERYPEFNRDSIGTVHTFQGGQKPVMILSTRQCRDSDSFRFINRRPNLLNTAVSRARELLILVGNLERLRQAGGHIGKLVEHIQQDGEVRELP
jgi:superfamily I DNA and/or RNA helicase